ncbi:MAG: hypothetical protein ACYTGC_05975 [Planctomycetota bacterium]|jgi:hypothetical protein
MRQLSRGSRTIAIDPQVAGTTPRSRFNYTLDPYFTDGNRVVFFISDDISSFASLTILDWE